MTNGSQKYFLCFTKSDRLYSKFRFHQLMMFWIKMLFSISILYYGLRPSNLRNQGQHGVFTKWHMIRDRLGIYIFWRVSFSRSTSSGLKSLFPPPPFNSNTRKQYLKFPRDSRGGLRPIEFCLKNISC